jgi:hypothetical protein
MSVATVYVPVYGDTTTYEAKPRTENLSRCEHIARTVEAVYNGEYVTCPECFEMLHGMQYEIDFDNGELCTCLECSAVFPAGELESVTWYDYFEDGIYKLEERISDSGDLLSVSVCVGFGGPNIYIDTEAKEVQSFWWGERDSFPISDNAIKELNEFFDELRNC